MKKLYEAYAHEKIPENHFEKLLAEYDTEQAELTELVAALQMEIDSFEAGGARADKFLDLAKRYTEFTDLTTSMLNEFIEKSWYMKRTNPAVSVCKRSTSISTSSAS